MAKRLLSIVIPSYNEEGNVQNTAEVVSQIMRENGIPFELVFVNDGSKDSTWDKLCELSKMNPNVVAVNFSRNFGKEAAIFAGLKTARGDAVVLMDCDLQHPPQTIVEMYNIWKNNDVDVVEGRKKSRGKENGLYKAFSLWFYKLIGDSSGLDMQDASDFKLLDRTVVDSLNAMPERLTFFRAMSSWVGYKTEKVFFEVADRAEGESKWNVKSLIKYAINSITSFTSAPLHIVTFCGVITFLISLILGVHTLVNKILGNSAAGFSTVIILQLLTSSIIMFSLGIIGYYLAKIYEEIKKRPRFIIRSVMRDGREQNGEKDDV
ncbi:glycosyltransferase family 2 protein [Ruminococcus sp. NK3A76]|uniref:glycosyltransferase family 2 protein n=1 Tax=Ruminococcus sp. NK3A76 TaxID=877411 RepID=UPI000A7E6E34|nr:glycosyltransferase family 2 protein [Ruminococcus sp. NK3A76]